MENRFIAKQILLKLFYVVVSLVGWINRNRTQNGYKKIYFAIGLPVLVSSVFIMPYNSSLLYYPKCLLTLIILVLHLHLLFCIITYEKNNLDYFWNLFLWCLGSFFLTFVISALLRINDARDWLAWLFFIGMLHFWGRHILFKYIKRWYAYFALFLFLPFCSAIAWVFVGGILGDIVNSYTIISDTVLGWMTLFLSIVLTNLAIRFTPTERLIEAKVAVYLMLAVFSSVSYCFFLSNYLAEYFYKVDLIAKSITIQGLQALLEEGIKWVSLPYLIGAVFGCFSVEWVERKKKLRLEKGS